MHRFFQAAEKVSTINADFRVQIGSVLVSNNKVVSAGFNTRRTHPLQQKYALLAGLPFKIFMHAEIMAIAQALSFKKLGPLEIYTFRKTRNGNLAMARPCPICMLAIKDLNITKIHYTTVDGFATEVIVK